MVEQNTVNICISVQITLKAYLTRNISKVEYRATDMLI